MGAGWTRRANVTGALAAAAPSEGSGGAATGGLPSFDPSATLGGAAGGAAVAPSDGVVTALGAIAGGAAAAPPAVTEGMAGGGGTFFASAAAMAAARADEPLLARSCSLAVASGVASLPAASGVAIATIAMSDRYAPTAQGLLSLLGHSSSAEALVYASGVVRRANDDLV